MHRLFETLSTPAPRIPAEQAADLLHRHYGLAGELERLVSERDQNFLVGASDGGQYILKFANAAEPADVTDFQNQALLHIARSDPGFPVPRVIETRDRALMFETTSDSGTVHRGRLLTWLEGVPLQNAEDLSSIAHQAGAYLARLGLALEDFEHGASDYPLLWDIRNAAQLTELLPYVDDVDLRLLCETRLARFSDIAQPRLDCLRRQVIHNDMNPSNVLVDSQDPNRLAGVIDFGDMVYSQLVNDVAVGAAYFCRIDDDRLTEVTDFVAAYTEIVPLSDDEISILPDLILIRHLTTVMITHWRASLYPENRDYILRNESRARRMLLGVTGLSTDDAANRFLDTCRNRGARGVSP